MAANAEITIVEARDIVSVGAIEPIAVQTPGIFVNYLVEGE